MYVGVETRANRLLCESPTVRQPKVCLSSLSIFERRNNEGSETCVEEAIFVGGARMGRKEVAWILFSQDFLGRDSGLYGAEFVAAGHVRRKAFSS